MKRKEKFFCYLLVFFLIYLYSSFFTGSNSIKENSVYRIVFISAMIAYWLVKKHYRGVNPLAFPIYFLLWCLAAFSCCLNNASAQEIVALTASYTITVIFCSVIGIRLFIEIFTNIIYFISLFSLVVYFAFLFEPGCLSFAPLITNSCGLTAGNLFFSITPSAFRNYGLFWEPGAFQIYINIAILFCLFCSKKLNTKMLLTLIFALVTTFSTTGYITLAVSLTAYLSGKKIEAKSYTNFLALLLLISCCFAAVAFSTNMSFDAMFNKTFKKIERFKEPNSSAGVRFYSFVAPLFLWAEAPVFGVSKSAVGEYFQANYNHSMITCTPVNWFASYGFFYGMFMLYGLFKLTSLFSKSLLTRFLCFTAILLSISSENVMSNPSFIAFIFMGIGLTSAKAIAYTSAPSVQNKLLCLNTV